MWKFNAKFTDADLDRLAQTACEHEYERTGAYTGTYKHTEFFKCIKCGRQREVNRPNSPASSVQRGAME